MATTLQLRDEILDFWFGHPGAAGFGNRAPSGFARTPRSTRCCANASAAAVEAALAGRLRRVGDPRGTLARVLLLDQFTRNSYRDTPRAFAGDAMALAIAQRSRRAR